MTDRHGAPRGTGLKPNSISALIVASTCVMFMLLSCVIAFISYRMYREAFYRYNNDICIGINAQTAYVIDGDQVERFAKSLTVDAEYVKFAEKLDELKNRTNATFLYVLVDNGVPGMYTYIYDATHAKEFPGERYALGRNETVAEYEGAAEVMATGTSFAKAEYYLGAYGELYYAYAPIRNSRGKVVGFLGTDINIAPWHERMKDYRTIVIATLLVAFFAFLAMYYFIVRQILMLPMDRVRKSALRLAHGDMDLQLQHIVGNRNDEIGQLGSAFEAVAHNIGSLIHDILGILDAAMAGRLGERAQTEGYEGIYLNIIQGVNMTLDAMCRHFDALPEGIAFFDAEHKLLYANRAMRSFMGEHGFDTAGVAFLAKTPPAPEPAPASPDTIATREMRLDTAGGAVRDYTVSAFGRPGTGPVMVVLSGVTQLVKARNDAEAASRVKSDFLSRMSHEIRTPMNAITGMSQIAKSSSDMQKIKSCIGKIESSSSHLLGIINDVLDISKIEAGKLVLDEEDFLLTEDVRFVMSMMQPKAQEKEIALALEFGQITHDWIRSDSLRLNQVLLNLLSNAVKFSRADSRIDVYVEERSRAAAEVESTYFFSVRDYGIGIDARQANRIFSPFEQAEASVTRKYGGTGLGLAISKSIVEMMGGEFMLESELDTGSTFSFTIRAASGTSERPAAPGSPEAAETAASARPNFSGRRMLIVDDIEINREIMLELLEETGIAMDTAEDGKDAVDQFTRSPVGCYDVILMDMQMPVMGGIEATGAIRSLPRPDAACVRIVAMTANVMKEDIERATAAGMNAHVGKPVNIDQLNRLLADMFRELDAERDA